MKCPKCGSKAFVIRKWEVCWYDEHVEGDQVTDTKHQDTEATGYARDSCTICADCHYEEAVVAFLEENDPQPTIPSIVPDDEPLEGEGNDERTKEVA